MTWNDSLQSLATLGSKPFAINTEKYPKKCGAHPIKYVRDLTAGYDNSRPDTKPILPVSSSTQMITFTLENGSVFTLRASGTEPKIKYYIEIILHKYGNVTEASKMLQEVKKALIEDFLQPDINKLVGHL
uniref:Alpha-D-phosphohexomutase C-terminal domain-containing protein n=1 Tax=Romanomermis culicivorax TaxID=13658 RepID=A0A915KJB8_ROMCU